MECVLCGCYRSTEKSDPCDVCGGKTQFVHCLDCGILTEVDSEATDLSKYCSRCLEIKRLKKWVDDLQSGMYINCTYCGFNFGPEDEVGGTMADALRDHMEVCPEHPMSKLKEESERAKSELCKLVDLDYAVDWPELVGMVKFELEKDKIAPLPHRVKVMGSGEISAELIKRIKERREKQLSGDAGRVVIIPSEPVLPKNLEECFEFLNDMDGIEEFKKHGPGPYHSTMGRYLRSEWGLWWDDTFPEKYDKQETQLHKYLIGLGLHHADDMSGLILESFHRHLNGKPLDIKGQVEKCKQYWAKQDLENRVAAERLGIDTKKS